MHRGDFEAAWRETDRLELPRRTAMRGEGFQREPWHLTWDGTPLEDRRVLIRCEHGLGDSIQFLRYCEVLQAQGCRVIVKAPPHLLTLLRYLRGIDLLLDGWTTDAEPEHDVVIECMELAYALRSTVETLPARVPYIDLATAAPFILPANPRGRNLGMVWAASDWNPRRSLPLAALAPVAALAGIRLYSLQQGRQQTEVSLVPFSVSSLSPLTTEILDAARAMMSLDAIITVDSMAAHLAGALGRPSFLLLTHDADWRWMRRGDRSPWYPTIQLFRQSRAGEWRDVVERLTTAISELPVTP